MRCFSPILIGLSCLSLTAQGEEPPKIERLFPPGIQRGTPRDVKLIGKPGQETLQVWSESAELEFEFSDDHETVHVTAPEGAVPDVHWLRFYNEFGSTDLLPLIIGVIPEAMESEPNNDLEQAQEIEAGPLTITGVLEKSGEVDTFGVMLSRDKTFIASMQANRDLGSPMDAVLQILDSRGTVIAQNDDDHGVDPQIVFDPPVDGQYFVRTFAFPATPNSTIKLAGSGDYVYRLTLTDAAFIDHVTPAFVDLSRENKLSLHGWNLTDESKSQLIPPSNGDQVVIAEEFSNSEPVFDCKFPSFSEAEAQPHLLPIPGVITGLIGAPGESDTYTMTLEEDDQVRVRVAARSRYSLLDPLVTVTDQTGKVVKTIDDLSRDDLDVEETLRLKQGSYTVSISDRYRHGGERYFYVFTCESAKPAFSASVKNNSFVLSPEGSLEIPVAIVRENDFSETITVSIEGLPNGIELENALSVNKEDTSKSIPLKLNKSESLDVFSGPIRIVCQGESGVTEFARAPIQNVKHVTSHLWLTVPVNSKSTPESKAK